jgi:hypothetical protein
MNSETKNILLLTATITPKSGVPNLKRTDPSVRLQDYKKALEFYLSKINKCCDGIVFAENSDSDVSELKQLVEQHHLTDQVEFVGFSGLDYPPSYDRGYGEFKLLDYAMKHSKLISNQTKRTVVWKTTGRYITTNLKEILDNQPAQFDIYCNCRNYPKRWVDTYIIAWTPEAYQKGICGVYERLKLNVPGIPAKVAAEEILRGHLDLWIREMILVRRFKVTPQIEGARGADNSGYSTDNLWKFRLRNACNTFLPWMWI